MLSQVGAYRKSRNQLRFQLAVLDLSTNTNSKQEKATMIPNSILEETEEASDSDNSSEITDSPLQQINTSIIPVHVETTKEGLLNPDLLVRTTGWMYKKGGAVNARGGFKSWRRRWFELVEVPYKDGIGYELQYFDSEKKTNYKGTIGLSEVEIFCAARSKHKRVKYEFQIVLQNGSKLELSCDDANEREEWIETLNMVIAYLRRLATASAGAIEGYDPMYEDDEQVYQNGVEVAANSTAFGPGLYGSEAGLKSHFFVQLRDLHGNPITKGGMPLSITIRNDDCLYYLSVNDNTDGTYAAQYALSRPGSYSLHVRINDEHEIFGSPFSFEILPAKTSPEHTIAEGTLTVVSPSNLNMFKIFAKDKFGNSKVKGGDLFEVGIMGPGQVKSLLDNEDGTYTCFFEAQHPSQVNYFAGASLAILVTLNGRHIQGSPFRPTILDEPMNVQGSMNNKSQTPSRNKYDNQSPSDIVSKIMSISPESKNDSPQVFNQDQLNRPDENSQSPLNNTANSAPLSRLERARQRALLARQIAENGQSNETNVDIDEITDKNKSRNINIKSVLSSPQPPNLYNSEAFGTPQGDINMKLSKLEVSMSNITGLTPNSSRLTSLASRAAAAKIAILSNGGGNGIPKLLIDIPSIILNLKKGMIGPQPPTLTSEEKMMWESAHNALMATEVVTLISNHLSPLKAAFDFFSEVISSRNGSSAQVLKLSNGRGIGAIKMLESYDIIHPYMSVKDAKSAFMLVLCSQRNSNESVFGDDDDSVISNSNSPANNGLDFCNYLKLLVLVATTSLSKTNTFSTLYSTFESRIEVMLNKWGLADPLKLLTIKKNLQK